MTDEMNSVSVMGAQSPALGTAQDLGRRSAPASTPAFSPRSAPHNCWWRIADFGVFGLWIAIVAFTISYHEKWADEAQAWLIARDLDLRTIWFHELRYEGSPGLWHTILCIAQHVFHAKYGAISYIGMAGAAAGVALLIFKAPFPRIVRWPLAFTYFMVYQYAVIARPYTFLPLLAFAAAILFKDVQHPERMTIVLVLLANLCVHGTILAGCFGLLYLFEGPRSWRSLEPSVRQRYQICVCVMALTFLFVYIVLKPTPDVGVFVDKQALSLLPAEARAQIEAPPLRKMGAIVSGAFLDYLWPSVLYVVLVLAWCLKRRRFLIFALPVGGMLALYTFHGAPHHQGTALVAAIAAIWIAWPMAEEPRVLETRERWVTHSMVLLMLSLCVINIWDAAVAIHRDYLYPYSGGEDAATYLKSVGADRGSPWGFPFGIVAVQAFFDHNIFANMPTAFVHHDASRRGAQINLDELRRMNPEYVVVCSRDPQEAIRKHIPVLAGLGYNLVHFSDGYLLYKRIVPDREFYIIFRRKRPRVEQGVELHPTQPDPILTQTSQSLNQDTRGEVDNGPH